MRTIRTAEFLFKHGLPAVRFRTSDNFKDFYLTAEGAKPLVDYLRSILDHMATGTIGNCIDKVIGKEVPDA